MKLLSSRRKIALIAATTVIIIFAGTLLSLRNRLSESTLVGHWQGQSSTTSGILDLDFRPNGTVIRNHRMQASYHVQGNQLIFSNIQSATAPKKPVIFQCVLRGNTLTIGADQKTPIAVLNRAM